MGFNPISLAFGNMDALKASNARLRRENEKLRRSLEILRDHGIEIVDAVAGGFEIYDKEHALDDSLQAENANLRKQVEALKQYAYALEECQGYACICEHCPHMEDDFDREPQNWACCYDFDKLKRNAGMKDQSE